MDGRRIVATRQFMAGFVGTHALLALALMIAASVAGCDSPSGDDALSDQARDEVGEIARDAAEDAIPEHEREEVTELRDEGDHLRAEVGELRGELSEQEGRLDDVESRSAYGY